MLGASRLVMHTASVSASLYKLEITQAVSPLLSRASGIVDFIVSINGLVDTLMRPSAIINKRPLSGITAQLGQTFQLLSSWQNFTRRKKKKKEKRENQKTKLYVLLGICKGNAISLQLHCCETLTVLSLSCVYHRERL